MLSPKINLVFNGATTGAFHIWQTVCLILLFVMSFIAITCERVDKDFIMKVMLYCITLSALHCILQFMGFHQWFVLIDINGPSQYNPSKMVTSTFGHPTFVAPLLVIAIPIAIYFKKYICLVILLAGLFCTQSAIGIASAICTFLFLFISKNKDRFLTIGTIVFLIGSLFVYAYIQYPNVRAISSDQSRIANWANIIQDMREPFNEEKSYALTGFGLGTFKYMYRAKHGGKLQRAHNEYLEILYEMGIIGFILFIVIIVSIFKKNLFSGKRKRYLLTSLFGMCMCAMGTFVWHLPATTLYTLIILALIYGQEENQT